MKHAPGFLKLVEEVMPRVHEVSVEEVARLLPPPLRGRVGEGGSQKSAIGSDGATPPPNPLPQGEGEFILIDVREDHEWNASHIPGAVHMARGIIERDIETKIPDKYADIVLYCGGGFRSALSADSLQKMGYTNVRSMAGGWRGWCEKGLPQT